MRTFAILALATQFCCASITASRTDRLQIMGTPAGAIVTVDGSSRGNLPLSVEVPRSGRSVVEVSAPGYRPATCDASMTLGGGYLAADVVLCLLLFPIGCIAFIDAGGAWNELRSPACNVSLVRDGAQAAVTGGAPQASLVR